MRFIHPLAPLELKYVALPADVALESRDCLTLYQALVKSAGNTSKSRLSELEPNTFFKSRASTLLRQKDVLEYEATLKRELDVFVRSSDENERQLARDVIDNLSQGFVDDSVSPQSEYFLDKEDIGSELVSLLEVLDKQQDLVRMAIVTIRTALGYVAKPTSSRHSLLFSLHSLETRWTRLRSIF